MIKKLFFVAFIFVSASIAAQTPILENFRIENNQPSRVYFDVKNGDISTLTKQGFIISGKSISSLDPINNYFTVSSAFTFWDNNTIRLKNGDGTVHDFTLTYITNNINQPISTGTPYYVRTKVNGGSDSNNGLSHATAFATPSKAVSVGAKVIYIEVGTYPKEEVNINYNGTPSNPILIQGYKTLTNGIPDPISPNYWVYGKYGTGASKTVDDSELPTFNNYDRKVGRAWKFGSNIIIKNVQVINYDGGIYCGTVKNAVLDNYVAINIGNTYTKNSSAKAIYISNASNVKLKNIMISDQVNTALRTRGSFNLLDNVNVIMDVGNGGNSPDYFISIYAGSNNIIKDCYVEKIGYSPGSAHGLGVKADKVTSAYNLIDRCTVKGTYTGLEWRHSDTKYNVAKNCVFDGNTYNIAPSNGSSYNIIENSISKNAISGDIYLGEGSEDGSSNQSPSDYLTFKNVVFFNSPLFLYQGSGVGGTTESTGNKWINCTIHNVIRTFALPISLNSTNEFINCSFSEIEDYASSHGDPRAKFIYSNFYNNKFSAPSGTNISKHNPQFQNANGGDFHLLPTSPIKDIGTDVNGVHYDKDGVERISTKNSIGAYDDETPTVGSVGPDVNICVGESTTLLASGGASYLWNTGETASSITVNPSTTTTYSVTISDGTNSDSHDVVVTVNQPPSVDAGSDVTICSGENITLTANGFGNFLWSTGETTSSITVSPTSTTTYTVTASNSCTDDATDQVIVNVTPDVNLTLSSDVEICLGESITLTAQSNGDFLWNTGETTAGITVSPASTTIYSVTSSLGDCSKTEEVSVTVNQAPSVNAGSDQTICSGENITLTANGFGNFLWSTGETTSSITVNPTSTTTYTVTASNSCTDDATDQVIVNVTPGVNLTLSSDVEICLGESITLTAQSNGDFLWNTGETTASITVSPASTTIYSVTSSLGDCSKTEEVSVTVNQAPSVNAGSDQTICSGENITLTANGFGNFLWSTGETTSSITVSPTSTTTYTVTASNSCTDDATDQVIVTVNDNPTITISEDVTIENGSSTVLTVTGDGNVSWSTGETSSSITVSPSTSTIYTVTLTTTKGCSVEDNVEVIVENTSTPDDSGTTVTADAGEDVYVCLDSNTELTATGGGLYLWSTGEITATINVSPTETTTYYVTVSDGSDIDINDVDEVTVYVDEGCSELVNRPTTEEFKVYPNPTNGILHMELSGYSNELNLSLFSSTGKIIHSEIISNYSLDKTLKRNINLRKFGKGIYYARIVNNEKNETKKVIVM